MDLLELKNTIFNIKNFGCFEQPGEHIIDELEDTGLINQKTGQNKLRENGNRIEHKRHMVHKLISFKLYLYQNLTTSEKRTEYKILGSRNNLYQVFFLKEIMQHLKSVFSCFSFFFIFILVFISKLFGSVADLCPFYSLLFSLLPTFDLSVLVLCAFLLY